MDSPLDDHLLVAQDKISTQLHQWGLASDTEVLWAGQPSKGNTTTSIARFIIGWLFLIMFLFTLNFFNVSKDIIFMTFSGSFLASIIFLILLFISTISEQAEIKKAKKTNFYLLSPNTLYLQFEDGLTALPLSEIEGLRHIDNKIRIDATHDDFELSYLADAKDLLNLLEEQSKLNKDA